MIPADFVYSCNHNKLEYSWLKQVQSEYSSQLMLTMNIWLLLYSSHDFIIRFCLHIHNFTFFVYDSNISEFDNLYIFYNLLILLFWHLRNKHSWKHYSKPTKDSGHELWVCYTEGNKRMFSFFFMVEYNSTWNLQRMKFFESSGKLCFLVVYKV